MKRGQTGREEKMNTGGEVVRAFIPNPLPPDPPVDITSNLQLLLEKANISIGRLDAVATLLPDTDFFLYTYIRKEAVLSSQIEGTQSSLSDLLLFELEEVPGVPTEDVRDVALYVGAMDHGLTRLKEGFPLSGRLIREIHKKLLSRGRGSSKAPGHFRRSQNWIGGSRPGRAVFVPPPPQYVADCMAALERFIHDNASTLPILVKTGLAHVQFETIHPFLDGNGRVGRLLITLMLCVYGVLKKPLLYLSLYFKENRDEYYRLLNIIRNEGDWEAWLEFFLEGVYTMADEAVSTAEHLVKVFDDDQQRIEKIGRAAGSGLRVHDTFKKRPVLSAAEAVEETGLSFPTVMAALRALEKLGVISELTGKRRNRLYGYERYLSIMNKGTE